MRKSYVLFFVSLLIVSSLACNAVLPDSAPSGAQSSDGSQEVVEAAVATVQKRLAADAGDPAVTTQANITVASDLQEALVRVYERANPAVVFIVTEIDSSLPVSGSGFVVDAEGHIVTNNHVILDGNDYEIQFNDGSRRRAELVGSDIHSDLAVLKVDDLPDNVEPLPLADFKSLRVGQFVAAIGNPFEEQGSLSFGIISGLGRTIASQEPAEDGGRYSLPQVIQTDAPINPGNSGGPLLNLAGEVVGVNSAIRSTTGFNTGVGFAIPVAAVKRIVPSLIETGTYIYPYMGIATSPVPLDLQRQEELGLTEIFGVYIIDVRAGSPAAEAGLIAAESDSSPGGDLIIAIDGHEVREYSDLISYLVYETEVGQTVDLSIVRDGETIIVPLTLGERPERPEE